MYKLLSISFIAALAYLCITGFHSIFGFWWITISIGGLLMTWLVLAVSGYIGMMAKKKWDESKGNVALKAWYLRQKNVLDAEVDKNNEPLPDGK